MQKFLMVTQELPWDGTHLCRAPRAVPQPLMPPVPPTMLASSLLQLHPAAYAPAYEVPQSIWLQLIYLIYRLQSKH